MLSFLPSWRAALRLRMRVRAEQTGQSLLEFALVMPLLLLIFSGAADLGRAVYNQVALENAVKEGSLYGARFPLCGDPSSLCLDPNIVSWHVQHETRNKTGPVSYASLVTPTISECQDPGGTERPTIEDCVAGDTYGVRAQLTFVPITPIISNLIGRITLTSQSNAIVINQAFDPTPGLAPTKFVLGTAARNAAELATKCVQPDPVGSPGFYRSPCSDVTSATPGTMVQALFRTGETITYVTSSDITVICYHIPSNGMPPSDGAQADTCGPKWLGGDLVRVQISTRFSLVTPFSAQFLAPTINGNATWVTVSG